MAKPEWGTRYNCYSCDCKFYDLNRSHPLCPKCGADQREMVREAKSAPRPSRAASSPGEEEQEGEVVDDAVEVGIDDTEFLDDEEEDDEDEDEEEL